MSDEKGAPMIERRPYSKLGGDDLDWLKTRHHFSFADYYSGVSGLEIAAAEDSEIVLVEVAA
jgi:hypothetical protein